VASRPRRPPTLYGNILNRSGIATLRLADRLLARGLFLALAARPCADEMRNKATAELRRTFMPSFSPRCLWPPPSMMETRLMNSAISPNNDYQTVRLNVSVASSV